MKYLKISLLMLLLSSSLTGCFDVKPITEIRGEDLYKTESGFWAALAGVYINMANEDGYGAELSWQGIEFMAWQHQNKTTTGDYYDLQRGVYDTGKAKSFVNNTWLRLYNIIAEANYLLFALDEYGTGVLKSQVYDNIKAQALMIRAFCHFDLIRLYAQGNLEKQPALLTSQCLPYVTEHTKIIREQKSYDWTLDRLIEDIEEAMVLFDDSAISKDLRVHKIRTNFTMEAAKLLAARVSLWRGNKEKALEYAEDFITAFNDGKPNYDDDGGRDLKWATENGQSGMFKDELIFYITAYNLFKYTDTSWDITNGNRLLSISEFSVQDNIFLVETVGDPSNNRPAVPRTPNLSSTNSDMRLANWYRTAEFRDNDQKGLTSNKIGPVDDNKISNILPLMRISECFLIAAECYIETDKTKAVELINTIRECRRIPQAYFVSNDITVDELKEVIKYEYLREFSQEGQIFFFYKRINEPKMVNSLASGEMDLDKYLLPYPENEQMAGHTNGKEDNTGE